MNSYVVRRVSELKQSISFQKQTKGPHFFLAVKATFDSCKLGKGRNYPLMQCLTFITWHIQLFQLMLSVPSMKLKDKTESLRGIFMNKFIKISHAWRKQ